MFASPSSTSRCSPPTKCTSSAAAIGRVALLAADQVHELGQPPRSPGVALLAADQVHKLGRPR
jgi:hypothetical protein